MKHTEEIKRLFSMYLEGKANASQKDILFRYLNSNKGAEQELFEVMGEVWEKQPAVRDDSASATKELENIWSAIEVRKQVKVTRLQIFKYAASVLILCSAAFASYTFFKPQSHAEKMMALITKKTAIGEKVKMLLPDSSVVFLGSNSRLSWPEHFAKGKSRNIRLEGEAFFVVKHDVSRPFIISSGKIQTQVLGTSFNIYAYPADKSFKVSVRTGKVGVTEFDRGKSRLLSLLTPGMELVYQKNTEKYTITNTRIKDINSWTSNRFVFRNEKLGDMLMKLERYYNIRFELKNPKLAACRFNATFNNKSINEVMKQLKIMSSGRIRYDINKDNTAITLWGEACQ